MNTVPGSPPLTVREAAAELNLSPATVRAWLLRRKIGSLRLGRGVRIPASEIRRLLEDNYAPPERQRR